MITVEKRLQNGEIDITSKVMVVLEIDHRQIVRSSVDRIEDQRQRIDASGDILRTCLHGVTHRSRLLSNPCSRSFVVGGFQTMFTMQMIHLAEQITASTGAVEENGRNSIVYDTLMNYSIVRRTSLKREGAADLVERFPRCHE